MSNNTTNLKNMKKDELVELCAKQQEEIVKLNALLGRKKSFRNRKAADPVVEAVKVISETYEALTVEKKTEELGLFEWVKPDGTVVSCKDTLPEACKSFIREKAQRMKGLNRTQTLQFVAAYIKKQRAAEQLEFARRNS